MQPWIYMGFNMWLCGCKLDALAAAAKLTFLAAAANLMAAAANLTPILRVSAHRREAKYTGLERDVSTSSARDNIKSTCT